MQLYPIVAPLCLAAALSFSACTRTAEPAKADAQTPPPGIRYEANVAAGGVVPPAVEIKNPHPDAQGNAKAGGPLFASMNCDGCHGGGAPGWVGPSLIDGRWRYGGADEEIFTSIFYGRPKGMPAYGGVVGADGVWMLVAYLKSQSRPAVVPTTNYEELDRPAPPAAAPPPAAAAPPAARLTPDQMITQYGCVACHAVDRKVVGPAFKDVAAKYKGQHDAEMTLEQKVHNGGTGVWGEIPMPPNPQVPEKDLQTLVGWVLAQK
jgi:cytochrome c551/c552